MKNSSTNEVPLIFQINRFVLFYDMFYYLHTSGNYNNYKCNINYLTYENIYILMLSNLCFLFDGKSAYSITNIKFSNSKVEKYRKEILKDWDGIKEKIIGINDNIGFLSYQSHENIRHAYHEFRRMDDKAVELMGKIKIFHTLTYLDVIEDDIK